MRAIRRTPSGSTIRRIAVQRLGLSVDFLPETELPPVGPKPFFSLLDQALSQEISARIRRPFWIDTVGRSNLVEIRIRLDDTVMRVFAQRSAAYASNSEIFLLWMVGTSLVLLAVAIIFLRNQIKPILRLADAAESFGKGREVPGFKPRGAREVRRAAQAFIEMKRRVERTMETAHHDARRRVARSAHDPDALQARAGAAQKRPGNRRDEEGRRRDGPHARGLSGFRQGRFRRAAGADRHGRVPRRAEGRRRAQRPQDQRGVLRPSGRDGAAGRVPPLPRQSGVERGALRQGDLDHRAPRSSLDHRHGG